MTIGLIFDLIVLAAVLISAGIAFFRGFIHEVLTILGVVGGVIIAFMMGPVFVPMIKNAFGLTEGGDIPLLFGAIPMDMVATVATYGGLFLIFIIVLNVVSHFLSKGASSIGLGPVDRTMGAMFGILRGVLVLAALYLPLHLLLSPTQKTEWFGNSQTHFYVEHVSEWLRGFLPHDMIEGNAMSDENSSARQMLQKLDVLEQQNQAAPVDNTSENISDRDRQKLDELIAPEPAASN